uniref:Uncharacterized protein n=1 Tax=Arundo donax TaxID=35708 RepID=A0A0A9ALJ8_ARUDO
MAAIERAPLIS